MQTMRMFVLIISTISILHTGAHAQMPGTQIAPYFGYEDCLILENQTTRVVLTEHGGRILEYAHKGNNAIYLDPSQEGWIYTPGEPTVDPTGGRLDIGPETTIPPHPDLWFGQWTGQITGPRAARLVSVEDAATGVQLIRDVELDEYGTHLRVTQTIKNISDSEKHWAHWSRTFGTGGGIVLIPLSGESRFPGHYIMYGPGPVMNYRPDDPNIRIRDGFIEVLATPERPKLGMDSMAGWFAYAERNDLLWVKRYPTYPDRPYREMAGLTISIWYYKDQMTELEPIGPRERIAPGKSTSFTEDWWLFPYEFPGDQAVDLEALKLLVETQAR